MELFGAKTTSWFDVWSLEHFVSGFSIYPITIFLTSWIFKGIKIDESPAFQARFTAIRLLFGAYVWEVFEFYMEAGYSNIDSVTRWFHGVEFWGNRMITDPFLVMIGGLIAMKHKHLIKYARIFTVIWLYFHVFEFPHCMYLQEEILGIN